MPHPWEATCCLSGFHDANRSGAVVSAHVHDRIFCETEGDHEGAVSHHNRIWLRADLHALFDARRFTFKPDTGELICSLTEKDRRALGLQPTGTLYLDSSLLTEQRCAYLRRRIFSWAEFMTQMAIAKGGRPRTRTRTSPVGGTAIASPITAEESVI